MICSRCNKPIAGTAAAPLVCTSLGTHHYACMRLAWAEHQQDRQARREASRARRSAAMKARWAAQVDPK